MSTPKKQTVFVGLSGGVDSSVAALRLLREGYRVVGVFIRTWAPDFLPCTIEADRLDAMRVAAKLNIPMRTFDATDAYRQEVAEYMIAEYRAGRTPNPDVMCNRFVKFGAFLTWALGEGADFVATGHYARVVHDTGTYRLLRGVDREKDQSYFLWTLTQQELAHVLFPVGGSVKSAVRREALHYSLPTAGKSDSQGICFLGEVDLLKFLGHFMPLAPGGVLDESGAVIGAHDGAVLYTVGQRHGFTVTARGERDTPRYVIGKDVARNTITVGTAAPVVSGRRITVTGVQSTRGQIPGICEAQFRYRQKPFPVFVEAAPDGRGMLIDVTGGSVDLPAPGQSCVFYRGEECLGGGTIETV